MIIDKIRYTLNVIFEKPKYETINVMYEYMLVGNGLIQRNLDTREYKFIEIQKKGVDENVGNNKSV